MHVESDGYIDDSDLEDEGDDQSDLPGSLTVASLTDSFDYQEPATPRTEEDITTRLGDADLMTDDEDVRVSLLVVHLPDTDVSHLGPSSKDIGYFYSFTKVADGSESS